MILEVFKILWSPQIAVINRAVGNITTPHVAYSRFMHG